jgi:hypothetical protein
MKLNDKQIDDLRLHNARMKLFINNFKTKALDDLQPALRANQTSKERFINNVDHLIDQVLEQVFVLSQRLHEHSDVSQPRNLSTPSLYTSSKRSSDKYTSGYESSSDCKSIISNTRYIAFFLTRHGK